MADCDYVTPHFEFSIEVNSALPPIKKNTFFDDVSQYILGATPHISSTTSAVSDVTSATVSSLLDTITVLEPASSGPALLVPVGELSFLSVMTSPITAYRHYESMQKTEQAALRTIGALGILLAGVKLVKGLALIARDVGLEISSNMTRTFTKAAKGMEGVLSAFGFIYYSLLILSFGFKLSHQVRFHYQLSKLSDNKAKDFLVSAYRDDPKLLEMKVGAAAYRIFKEAIEGRDDKVVRIDPKKGEVHDIALGLGEVEKVVARVKKLGRVEMLMRVFGITAAALGIISIGLLIPLSGTAAVAVSLILPFIGSILWVITDGFEIWNMLKDGEFSAKKVLALTAIFSSLLLITNLIIMLTGPIASVAAIGGMVAIWVGFLGFMAYVHKRQADKTREEQAEMKVENRACA